MVFDRSREMPEEEFYPLPLWYRAPSWSWASIDEAVTFPKLNSEYNAIAEIISCTAEPLPGSEPVNQLLGGALCIYGPVVEIDYLLPHPEIAGRMNPICRTGDHMPCREVRGLLDNGQEFLHHLTEERSIPVLVLFYDPKEQRCVGIILWKAPIESHSDAYRRLGVTNFQLCPGDYFHYGKPKSFPDFKDKPDVTDAYLEYVRKSISPLMVLLLPIV